jgi:hypothetical protein
MSRYWGEVVITFTDGTTETVGGNRERVQDGVLTVWTQPDPGYGPGEKARRFPLINIREWHWKDGAL